MYASFGNNYRLTAVIWFKLIDSTSVFMTEEDVCFIGPSIITLSNLKNLIQLVNLVTGGNTDSESFLKLKGKID